MPRVLRTAAVVVAIGAAVLPAGVAGADWEEREVCKTDAAGDKVCHVIRVYTPDPPSGDDPQPDGFGPPPREESWFDKHCRMVRTDTPPVVTADGTILREYIVGCDGFPDLAPIWVAEAPPGGPPVPPVDPRELAQRLWASMRVEFPVPTAHVAPSDQDANGFAYVQTPTFFWVDDFRPITRTLTLGPTWVTLTATPVRIDIDTGTGATISCASAPPFPWGTDPGRFKGCSYVYRDSSAMASNGETWPVTATVVWISSWTSSSGAGGSLGETHMVSAIRFLPVAEIQAVVVDG